MVSVDNPLAATLVQGEMTETPCPHCPGQLKERTDDDGTTVLICPVCKTTPRGGMVLEAIEFSDEDSDRLQYCDEHIGADDNQKYVQDGAVPYFTRRASWFDTDYAGKRNTILEQ